MLPPGNPWGFPKKNFNPFGPAVSPTIAKNFIIKKKNLIFNLKIVRGKKLLIVKTYGTQTLNFRFLSLKPRGLNIHF